MFVCGRIKIIRQANGAFGVVDFQDHISNRVYKISGQGWPSDVVRLRELTGGIFLEIAAELDKYSSHTLLQAVGESIDMATALMPHMQKGSQISTAVNALIQQAAFDGRVLCAANQFVQRMADMPHEKVIETLTIRDVISVQTAHKVAREVLAIFSAEYAEFASTFPLLSREECYQLWTHVRPRAARHRVSAVDFVRRAPFESAHAATRLRKKVTFHLLDAFVLHKLYVDSRDPERVRCHAVDCIRTCIKDKQHSEVIADDIIESTTRSLAVITPRLLSRGRVRAMLLDAWTQRTGPAFPESDFNAPFGLGQDEYWAVAADDMRGTVMPLPHLQAEQRIVHWAQMSVPQPPPPKMTNIQGLHALQVRALENLFARHVSIITGSPGSGKTRTAAFGILWMVRAGFQVAIGCPTGKAAQRMATALYAEAERSFRMTENEVKSHLFLEAPATLHRLIRTTQQPEAHGARSEKSRPLAIVVDETSMVGLQMMGSLINRFSMATKWMLVGDPFQLPSIEPGRVLLDLIDSRVVVTSELTHIFRTRAEGRIICENARVVRGFMQADRAVEAARAGTLWSQDRARDLMSDDAFVMRVSSDLSNAERSAMAVDFYQKHKNDFAACQVLCQKTCTCDAINRDVREKLNPPSDAVVLERKDDAAWRVGDRVMCTKNLYRDAPPAPAASASAASSPEIAAAANKSVLVVSNGEIGTLVGIEQPGDDTAGAVLGDIVNAYCRVMVVRLDSSLERVFVASRMFEENFVWAYAITTHKAQGCEWDHVLLNIDAPGSSPLHTAHLVYTGFTRAKKSVIIDGTLRKLETALANTGSVHERRSHLAERIRRNE